MTAPLVAMFCLVLAPGVASATDAQADESTPRPFLDVTSDLTRHGIHPVNAKGDGIADDTAPIQAAVDSVADVGGTVFLPPGLYMIKSIAVPPGVTFAGAGMDQTTLRPIAKATALIAITGGTVSGLTAYGTSDESASGPNWKPGPRGRYKDGTSRIVHLLMVKGALDGAVITNVRALEPRHDCLYVRGTKGLRVRNCIFNRAGRNVVSLVGNDEDFVIERCHFGPLWGLYLFDIEPGTGDGSATASSATASSTLPAPAK